jgi:hypothetical protein
MNTQLNGLFNQGSTQKETSLKVQKENTSYNGRSFTTADLWNIQRNSKNRLQRRFL